MPDIIDDFLSKVIEKNKRYKERDLLITMFVLSKNSKNTPTSKRSESGRSSSVTILLIEPVWYIIAMFSLPLIGYVLWVFVICFREVKELWEG